MKLKGKSIRFVQRQTSRGMLDKEVQEADLREFGQLRLDLRCDEVNAAWEGGQGERNLEHD